MHTYLKLGATFALIGSVSAANAFTMATFADPTTGGGPAMFTMTATSISGGWSGTGLTLETPGWAGPDIANARFTMAPVIMSQVVPGFYLTGPGSVNFTDAALNPILTVSFTGGQATFAGFGGNMFTGSNVTFSGPGVPGGLTQGAFAFSFANVQQNQGTTTATAAFTSSAVPEPASLAMIGIGAAALVRRRRTRQA